MKQWVTIVLAVFAAAVLQTAAERCASEASFKFRTAVLTQQQDVSDTEEIAPLLATSTTSARQLAGAEPTPGKTNRTEHEIPSAVQHKSAVTDQSRLWPGQCTAAIVLPGQRTTGRYIYFLRCIVI